MRQILDIADTLLAVSLLDELINMIRIKHLKGKFTSRLYLRFWNAPCINGG